MIPIDLRGKEMNPLNQSQRPGAIGGISRSTIKRLPVYLSYLKSLPSDKQMNISAPMIASALNLGEVQVRKDLAAISDAGKPRVGYHVPQLVAKLEEVLGYNDVHDAVLGGAGKLGRALMGYSGFSAYGLNIVAGFDADESIIGQTESGKQIFSMTKFEDLCGRLQIKIGIITVPAACAQAVCDLMTQNGILAIWNFAPIHLRVSEEILVQNENMAASLAILSGHLSEQVEKLQQ